MKFIIFQIFLIQFLLCQFGFAQQKIHWEIYNLQHKKISEINAEDVSIHGNVIWYKEGDKFGIKDIHQKTLVKPKYETITHYTGGLTVVGIKGCFSMVYQGKEILPFKYDYSFIVYNGYFRADEGCSDDEEAYIITTPYFFDKTGTLLSRDRLQAMEDLVVKKRVPYREKEVSNGFTIKLLPPEDNYVKKGIFNSKDSLIFSCTKCQIADYNNGEFVIYQKRNTPNETDAYIIDTTGVVRVKGNYNHLLYDSAYHRYLYKKSNEYGFINSDRKEHHLVKADYYTSIYPLSKNRFLLSTEDSLYAGNTAICDSLGTILFSPTKDWLKVVGENCLLRRTAKGYLFIDNDGHNISNTLDSAFSIPPFDYREMVLGEHVVWGGYGNDAHGTSPLDYDGIRQSLNISFYGNSDYYVITANGLQGWFDPKSHEQMLPQYSMIAKVDNNLFAVKKNGRWHTIDRKGKLNEYKNSTYINFFENYVLIGH